MANKTIEENVELCKKYPFLIPRNVWTGQIVDDYDYSWTVLDEIPDGWKIAFGDMLIEEIGEALEITGDMDTFQFEQIKEKWGALRMYCRGGNKLVDRIVDKYSVLSENICMICGKPDVYMTDAGWMYPCCEQCWDKKKYSISYENAVIGDSVMLRKLKWLSCAQGSNEWIDHELDISSTAEKIREEYKRRCESLK